MFVKNYILGGWAQIANVGDIQRATVKAATQGVKDAVKILRYGETAAQLEHGVSPIGATGHDLFGDVHTRSALVDSYINAVSRLHGAAYRPFKVFAMTRALQEQARLQAGSEGLKGDAYQERVRTLIDDPTPAMATNAIQAAETATFLNRNAGTQAFTAAQNALRQGGPVAHGLANVVDFFVPIKTVPVNIIARMLEYTPLGMAETARRAVAVKLAGEIMTPQQQADFSRTFGRSAAGLGVMLLGYKMAKQGLATGATGKREGDKPEGAVRVGDRWYELGSIAPIGNLFTLGATLHDLEAQHAANPEGRLPLRKSILNLLAEQPYLRAASDITNPYDTDLTKQAGQAAGSVVPTVLSDLAAQMDNEQRKRGSVLDYIKARIPGLRSTLPGTGHPETSKLFDPFNSRPAK